MTIENITPTMHKNNIIHHDDSCAHDLDPSLHSVMFERLNDPHATEHYFDLFPSVKRHDGIMQLFDVKICMCFMIRQDRHDNWIHELTKSIVITQNRTGQICYIQYENVNRENEDQNCMDLAVDFLKRHMAIRLNNRSKEIGSTKRYKHDDLELLLYTH